MRYFLGLTSRAYETICQHYSGHWLNHHGIDVDILHAGRTYCCELVRTWKIPSPVHHAKLSSSKQVIDGTNKKG